MPFDSVDGFSLCICDKKYACIESNPFSKVSFKGEKESFILWDLLWASYKPSIPWPAFLKPLYRSLSI